MCIGGIFDRKICGFASIHGFAHRFPGSGVRKQAGGYVDVAAIQSSRKTPSHADKLWVRQCLKIKTSSPRFDGSELCQTTKEQLQAGFYAKTSGQRREGWKVRTIIPTSGIWYNHAITVIYKLLGNFFKIHFEECRLLTRKKFLPEKPLESSNSR